MFRVGDTPGSDLTSVLNDSAITDDEKARKIALRYAKTKEDSLDIVSGQVPAAPSDTNKKNKSKSASLNFEITDFTTRASYDSSQNALPATERDGWLTRTKIYKQIEISQKFKKNPEGMIYTWLAKFMRMFPQLLFVSLPIFALTLKFLYRRKKVFYADHAIFSIHLYIFTFIALLVYFLLVKLYDMLHWGLLNFMIIGIGLYMVFYTYIAMRNFYKESRLKTFVKYFLLSIISFIVLIILFGSFFMVSIYQI